MATGNTYAIPTWSEVTGLTKQIEDKINEIGVILDYLITTGGTYSGYIYPAIPNNNTIPTGGTFTMSYTISNGENNIYSITISELELTNFNWNNQQQSVPFYFVAGRHLFSEGYAGKKIVPFYDHGEEAFEMFPELTVYCHNYSAYGFVFEISGFDNYPMTNPKGITLTLTGPCTIKLATYIG